MLPPEDTVEEAQQAVEILIVDDRAENRAALRAILSGTPGSGYELVEAGAGAEALRRILDHDFAVLLIDVLMPEMDGFELARLIKRRERSATIPIVFLTAADGDIARVYQAYEIGAVDYLIKPLVPEIVRAKVAVFAELHRRQRRIARQAALLLETGRKEGELRLAALQLAKDRRYLNLAEAIPHIVWTAGPDGTVDYFNRRWYEYTRIAANQAMGRWEGALHPEDGAACRAAWRQALERGEEYRGECRLRRGTDGSYRWHLCRAVPERGPSGEVVAWVGSFTDIDEQKRSQAAFAEFRETLDAVLDAVFIFDADMQKLLYANRGASVLLGVPADRLLGRAPRELLPQLDDASVRGLLGSHPGDGKVHTVEIAVRHQDGREIPVELSLQRIEIDGLRVVSIGRDITDRKRAELERDALYREALNAIRARDEFLSIASHELKTPLTPLRLQVDSLLRVATEPGTPLPEPALGKLRSASRQITRLVRLIDQLLDVSRIRAGRLTLELEPVDLAALVRDVASRSADEAERAGSTLVVLAEGAVAGRWDRLRIDQVVTNLVTNALKFGGGQPIDLAVEDAGELARLRVHDRGIGIAPEDRERIFQRFERAVLPGAYGGMGLGLYIVRQIVEAHGGTIGVKSAPGDGSTFVVELPKQPTAAVNAAGAEASERRPGIEAEDGKVHLHH